MVKKAKSQRKAHLFDSRNPISIMKYLAVFNIAANLDDIHEEAAM